MCILLKKDKKNAHNPPAKQLVPILLDETVQEQFKNIFFLRFTFINEAGLLPAFSETISKDFTAPMLCLNT